MRSYLKNNTDTRKKGVIFYVLAIFDVVIVLLFHALQYLMEVIHILDGVFVRGILMLDLL